MMISLQWFQFFIAAIRFVPLMFVSFSIVFCRVFVGRPLLRGPSGFQSRTLLAASSWRITLPARRRRLCLTMVMIRGREPYSSWLVMRCAMPRFAKFSAAFLCRCHPVHFLLIVLATMNRIHISGSVQPSS